MPKALAAVKTTENLWSTLGQSHLYVDGGRYRLAHGDAIQILDDLPAGCADLIFADPPYFLSNGGSTCSGGRRVTVHKGDWDQSGGVNSDHDFNLTWLKACQRVLKPSGTLWVSGTQHVIFSIGFAMQSLGYHLLNTITWYKPNAAPNLACRFFTHSTELVLWAAPARTKPLQHTFFYRDMKQENGGKQMRDLWQFPDAQGAQVVWALPTPAKREKTHGRHPTQKPIELLERIVRSAAAPDSLVIDPFNGSGTTGVAALRHGCRYFGIDRDENYLKLSDARLSAETMPATQSTLSVQRAVASRRTRRK